jgi:hypothetical protein
MPWYNRVAVIPLKVDSRLRGNDVENASDMLKKYYDGMTRIMQSRYLQTPELTVIVI